MKKYLVSFAIIAVLAVAMGSTNFVYAQTATTPTPTPQATTPGFGYGRGMGGGMMNRSTTGTTNQQFGYLHDEIVAALSQKLGLSVTDLNARLAKGETMLQIAASKGITADKFTALMTEVHTTALAAAVKSGKITQQQADWMKERGNYAAGQMNQRGGMMGGGRGGYNNQQNNQRGGMGGYNNNQQNNQRGGMNNGRGNYNNNQQNNQRGGMGNGRR